MGVWGGGTEGGGVWGPHLKFCCAHSIDLLPRLGLTHYYPIKPCREVSCPHLSWEMSSPVHHGIGIPHSQMHHKNKTGIGNARAVLFGLEGILVSKMRL